MAKREMSTTLKNLKFMQRATLKVEPPPPPPKEEEEEQVELKVGVHLNFASPNNIQNKKCLVIMEGNPHPEVLRGRISFQNFNPSIDKLNEAVANSDQSTTPVTSSHDGKTHSRENGSLSNSRNVSRVNGDDDDGGHERKQTRSVSEIQKSPRNRGGEAGQQSPANNSRSSQKKQKREKLDWNLLRPPKAQKRPA